MESAQEAVEFANRASVPQTEEYAEMATKFDSHKVSPCVTRRHTTRPTLMFAYMNGETLKRAVTAGLAHHWPRFPKSLWKSGENSGMLQTIKRWLIDDGQSYAINPISLDEPKGGGAEAARRVRRSFAPADRDLT